MMDDFYKRYPYSWFHEIPSMERLVEDIHEINFLWKLLASLNPTSDDEELANIEQDSQNIMIETLKKLKSIRQINLINHYKEHLILRRDKKMKNIISIEIKGRQMLHRNAAHIPLRILKEYQISEDLIEKD